MLKKKKNDGAIVKTGNGRLGFSIEVDITVDATWVFESN